MQYKLKHLIGKFLHLLCQIMAVSVLLFSLLYVVFTSCLQTEMSKELLEYFECPQTLEHEGGHFVPTSGDVKRIYTEFLSTEHKKRLSTS